MIRTFGLCLTLMTAAAQAEVPRVVADIAPVHGLVSMVMGDLGTPGLVMPTGASPHDHALRPSEAGILQEADVVFWIGEALTPGLARPLASLASGAQLVTLSDIAGVHLLARREAAVFAEEDHAHEEDHDHAHAGDSDPHLWLDPDNALLWLAQIAATLAEADPDNAVTYRANAKAATGEVAKAVTDARSLLVAMRDRPFVAFHDAYHYFEEAFGLTALGSLSVSDAAPPSPARLDALRDTLSGSDVACVVAEPQYTPGLIAAVSDGVARPVIVADPMGAELALGAGFYPALIRDLAAQFADCGAAG